MIISPISIDVLTFYICSNHNKYKQNLSKNVPLGVAVNLNTDVCIFFSEWHHTSSIVDTVVS